VSHYLTTCTFCGVGCGIYLETTGNEITGTYPSMSHPANQGRICVRGWHVHEVASSPDRLLSPLVRKNGKLEPVNWDEAYDTVASRLKEIRDKYGPDSIGFINSARCANEDGYILQKFARTVIGTNNVDQGTSPYRTNSVEVLLEMISMPAATNSIGELPESKVIILNEIDVGQQLPTIGGVIIRAKLRGAKLIVVGARRHRVAEHADIFLYIRPATEAFLYAAMAKVIVDRGIMDLDFIRSHCEGYDHFLKNIRSFDLLLAARRCDVSPLLIEQAAIEFARLKPGMLLYSTGAEAHGKDALHAMVNLVLLTGNLGKCGSGIMPLAEHNNLQGGCDMGMLPGYLPGYAEVNDPSARERFSKKWNAKVPEAKGLDTTEMLCETGSLKAVWLDRHNPVVSAMYCDAGTALDRMELVVLQNLFLTRTAEYAHVILPTVAFGEEAVTFTSTERRIQAAVKTVEPPPGLKSAWEQVAEVAWRMGARWDFASSEDVLAEAASLVPAYSGVTHENLTREYGRQWPCTKERPLGTPRLFADGEKIHPFRFKEMNPVFPEEPEQTEFPFVLWFGHSLYYWLHNTLVQHSEVLKREYGILLLDYPDGFIEVNPDDAKSLNVRDGEKIRLVAPAGDATATARVTAEVRRGIVYVPYFLQDVARRLRGGYKSVEGRTVHVRIEKAV
jgi:predicted molibdopterin-dependent oxidoreductase YjgC